MKKSKLKKSKLKKSKLKRSCRKTRRRMRGGDSNCEIVQNTDFFDTEIPGKKNKTWDTNIVIDDKSSIKVRYLTCINQIIRAVETTTIPEFIVKMDKEKQVRIMIKDKYVSCFLRICGEWYVVMRLYGTVLSPVTFSNGSSTPQDTFYKLENISIDDTSLITIKNYDVKDNVIVIKDFEPVDANTLPKLISFRDKQLLKKQVKTAAAVNGVNAFAGILKIFGM